jgi:hypothetical protein
MRAPPRAFRSRPLRLSAVATLAWLGLVSGASCTSDRGSLARRPNDPAGGAGGTGGAAGSGGSPAAGKSNSSGGKSGGDGAGGKVTEPPGKSLLTVTHGIVDAPTVAWCFARVRDGQSRLVGSPQPKAGVAYGASIVLDELPSTDLGRDGVVALAIAGELARVADLNCEEAVALAEREMGLPPAGHGGHAGGAGEGGSDAAGSSGEGGQGGASGAAGETAAGGEGGNQGTDGGAGDGAAGADDPELPEPPSLRVGALPALPPGALSEGYSLLLVSAGCLGGPAFSHDLERQVCGSAYRPRSPTLTGELVVLSRSSSPSTFGFQTLHASVASGELAVSIAPPPSSLLTTVTLSLNMTQGMLRPREPRLDLAPTAYGSGGDDWSVQVTDSSGTPIKEQWSAVLARGGIDELELDHAYTLIVIGPGGGLPKRSWWNAPAVTIIDNAPSLP